MGGRGEEGQDKCSLLLLMLLLLLLLLMMMMMMLLLLLLLMMMMMIEDTKATDIPKATCSVPSALTIYPFPFTLNPQP